MSILELLVQVGISIVVVVLYHLWVSRKEHPAAAAPAPRPVATPVAPPATPAVVAATAVTPPKITPAAEPMPPEMLAVIAAAIAVVLGRPHRVVSVQQGLARTPEANVWAMEGRVEQFMSHKVR